MYAYVYLCITSTVNVNECKILYVIVKPQKEDTYQIFMTGCLQDREVFKRWGKRKDSEIFYIVLIILETISN